MTKAKELARALDNECFDVRYKGHVNIDFLDKVGNLIEEVLSEPDEPCGLKGWIEVTRLQTKAILLLNIKQITNVGFELVDGVERGYLTFGPEAYIDTIESYDEIKQKIKEAS